jgi:hypothetical protein
VLDLAPPQMATVAARRIGFVALKMIGPSTRVSAGWPRDPDLFQHRDQLRGITPLTGSDDEAEWATSTLTRQMDLAGQPAS